MTTVAVVLSLAVVVVGLVRLVVPALGDRAHPRDIAGWHVAMGALMVPMLLGVWAGTVGRLALAVFTLGMLWSLARAVRARRGVYASLALCCGTMLVMALPLVAGAGRAGTFGMPAMPSFPMTLTSTGPGGVPVVVPLLGVGALGVVGFAALVRLAGTHGRTALLANVGEVVMIAAMATALTSMA